MRTYSPTPPRERTIIIIVDKLNVEEMAICDSYRNVKVIGETNELVWF